MRRKTLRFSAALSIFLPILAAEAQDVDVPGNLTMRNSTATQGNILKGGVPFLHNIGFLNTFLGIRAGLFLPTTGSENTGIGVGALGSNTSGNANTAIGGRALSHNERGDRNTACGALALWNNTDGGQNVATGGEALRANTIGINNTAVGFQTLVNNFTGNNNTVLGSFADVSARNLTNATAIGASAVVDASNKIRFGNDSVTVIEGLVGFTANSDRNRQENFQPVLGEEVLRKIRDLSLTSWNFIGQPPGQFRHYGPAAQDFFAAFGNDGIGTIGTPTTITSTDIEGILMVAVQALERRTEDQDEQIDALKARLEALERIVGEVAGR